MTKQDWSTKKLKKPFPFAFPSCSSWKIPPSIKLFLLMFQSCPQNKELTPNNTHPQHSAPPKSSRRLLKGSGQLLRFTPRSLHQSSEIHFRDQRWCTTHWISYKCPLIPSETLTASLPSPQLSTTSEWQPRRVSCPDLCPMTHMYAHIHTQILFWHNGARADISGQQLVTAVEKVGGTLCM